MTDNTQSARIASLEGAEEQLRTKSLLERAIHRVSNDYLTLTGLIVIAILTIMSYSAPLIVSGLMDIDYNNPDLYNRILPPNSTVSDSNSTVWQWVVETGESRRPFIGHIHGVVDLDFHATEPVFTTLSSDGTIRVWHIPTGRTQRRLNPPRNSDFLFTAVSLSTDGVYLLTGTDQGVVNVYEREKADQNAPDVISFEAQESLETITSVDFSPDGTLALAGNASGQVMLWDIASSSLLNSSTQAGAIEQVTFSADGNFYAVTDASGIAVVRDVSTHEDVLILDNSGSASGASFSPDGELIATASDAGNVIIWQMDGTQSRTIEHDSAVNSVAFTDNTTIILGTESGDAFLQNVTTGEIIQSFTEFEYPVNEALLTSDGETLITATQGRERYYILGTDTSGRDHFSRLLYAGQISLKIGFLAGIGALTIGVVVGVISGFFGGKIDDFIMWIITTLDSIPSLYLLLIISALLAPNENSLILILVFLGWTGATRIVRGETFSLREREFVMAARAVGASNIRIMFVHIVPNVMSILLIVLSSRIGGLILVESTLSFLGFGVKPPTPTWGNMLSGDLGLLREAPHLVFAPGLLILVTVLCLYVVGDGLRDAFDPNISD